jgi:uncharacterized paraquat-inducible protein A
MSESATEKRGEVCHRCLQPVPSKATRCPNCGDPLRKGVNIRTVLGIFGLVIFLAVAVIGFRMMQNGSGNSGSTQTEQPEKKPALGQ